MGEKILLGDRELVPPKVEYRSSRSVVVSWTRNILLGDRNLSHPKVEYRSSQISRLMDAKVLLGDRELVPPKIEYRSSRLIVVSWTKKSSWEIGNLSLRAAELMSLNPSYSIRRAFYFE